LPDGLRRGRYGGTTLPDVIAGFDADVSPANERWVAVAFAPFRVGFD
jgi:hypothetical protein